MKSTLAPRSLPLVGILIASAALAADTPTPAPKPDPWKPVRMLLGKSEGEVQGQAGAGRAECEYAFALNNRFIHVVNKSIYPPQEKNKKGETHEDVGYISYDKAAKNSSCGSFTSRASSSIHHRLDF